MSFNRRQGRPDRGRPDRFDRPDRAGRFDRPDRPDRGGAGDRRGGEWQPRDPAWRPAPRGGAPRRQERHGDEGGMSLRLDPRRLSALKQLAGEAGLRPGELVTRWVEERIDAERHGGGAGAVGGAGALGGAAVPGRVVDETIRRLDALSARVAALEEAGVATIAPEVGASAPDAPPAAPAEPAADAEPATPPRPRVPLHDEISAVISERGPSTAAEIAQAIVERGRYAPPRSAKPLDAATVNSRVSNPVYRDRFVRREGRIGLAEPR